MLSPSNPILIESPISITAPSTAIRDILDSVYLGYLPQREGGWACARKEFYSLLKNGDKEGQKHRRWAVLDQRTYTVSSDVEVSGLGFLLDSACDLYFYKPSIMKHHELLLTLNGPGGANDESEGYTPDGQEDADAIPGLGGWIWTLTPLDSSMYQDTQKRKEELREVKGWEKRVKHLDVLLGRWK
ncbi:ATP-binding cassette long-chain fatty acid transporter pxa1 [Marasmius sp. AFHP31]|nr:ATP-binding cassette long-chain fatty acid transporter pxa1 [Marasmius sp. AFHP31]